MPSQSLRAERDKEWEFELPISMIDVVFLLLIFFLLSSRFKENEKKLDANLPKDEGQNPGKFTIVIPNEIRVKIYWMIPDSRWPIRGRVVREEMAGARVAIMVGKTPCRDLNQLAEMLQQLVGRNPDKCVVIDARQNVPFKWVLGAIDACARAEVEKLKFQAPPIDESIGGGDDWWYM